MGEMGYKATGNADLHSFFVGIPRRFVICDLAFLFGFWNHKC